MRIKVQKYNKFIVALAGFVAAVSLAFSDGELSDQEFAVLVSSGVTALGVFGVRNKYLDEAKDKADDWADDRELD